MIFGVSIFLTVKEAAVRCECECGAYMAHAEHSAECVCPNCGAVCAACLGLTARPLSVEELQKRNALGDDPAGDETEIRG